MTTHKMPMLATRYKAISLSNLEEIVDALSLSALDILFTISGMTNQVNDFHPNPALFVPSGLLAFATIVTKGVEGDIEKFKKVPNEKIVDLLQMAMAADGELTNPIETQVTQDKAIKMLCRVVGLQTALQGELLCRLCRFAYILGLIEIHLPNSTPQESPRYPGKHRFTIEHMRTQFTVLFWMLSNRMNGLSFTTTDIVNSSEKYPDLKDAAEQMLHNLSFTANEAIKHENKCNKRNIIGFAIPYDLMARKPFLKLDEDRYLRMPGAFQQLAATHGLFFQFRQFLLRKRKEKNKTAETVLNTLGKRFEYYCFTLMKECLPNMEAFPEMKYDIKGSKESPDGVFYDYENKTLVLLQAKLKPPTAGLLLGDTSIDINRNDMENAYAEMFCESIRFLYDIKQLRKKRKLSEKARELSNCFEVAEKIILICLAPTLPPVFHWGPGIRLLREAIHKKLKLKSNRICAMYDKYLRNRTISDCLLLCDPEPFEIHSFKKPGISVLPSIEAWWENLRSSTEEQRKGLPVDFREYVVESSGESQPRNDQLIGHLWNKIKELHVNLLEFPES